MSGARVQRVFLVGCARSGTTLLQSLLASHPSIASYPESHFFRHLSGGRRWRWVGLPSRRARPRLEQFLGELAHPSAPRALPRRVVLRRQYVSFFLGLLDSLALGERKAIWIEKTPSHLWHLDEIERLVPGAKFIHIVRDGTDVVASLYDVTHRYPEVWGGARSIDACIDRWLKDVAISRRYEGRENHLAVSYERLVDSPREVLEEICSFLGIEYANAMLRDHRLTAERVVLESEPWKSNAFRTVRRRPGRKFEELFEEEEQRYILARLSPTNPLR
jgi:hypothetical protein